jgi:hypothetical protein
MATSTTTAVLVRYEDPLDVRERGAIAGFLAGYTGATRVSYTTDLRLFASWCTEANVRLLDVKRAHLELFAWQMEADGRMRSTRAAADRLFNEPSFRTRAEDLGKQVASMPTPQDVADRLHRQFS